LIPGAKAKSFPEMIYRIKLMYNKRAALRAGERMPAEQEQAG